MKRVIRFVTLAITALLLSAIAYAQQQPPAQIPLGDLVRQQKAAKKAKKVVTDEDIPARAPEPAPATATAAGGDAQSAGDAAKAAEAKGTVSTSADEKARQDKIKDLKESEEAEKRVIGKMEEALADPTLSDNRRRMYEETLRLSHEQLDKFTKEREALEKQKPSTGS